MKIKTKIFLWPLLFLAVLLFVVSAALPSWISSTSGTKSILKWVNAHSDAKLTIERIELSWWGAQHLKNLKLEDKRGEVLFSFLSFDTDTSLLRLLFRGSLNKTVLQTPYLYLTGKTKEEREEEKGDESKKKRGKKTENSNL